MDTNRRDFLKGTAWMGAVAKLELTDAQRALIGKQKADF